MEIFIKSVHIEKTTDKQVLFHQLGWMLDNSKEALFMYLDLVINGQAPIFIAMLAYLSTSLKLLQYFILRLCMHS